MQPKPARSSPPPFLSVAAIPPPIALPANNAQNAARSIGSSGSGGGGGSLTSHPSAIEEYRTTDAHLTKRIGDVRAVLDEFFEDVDLAVVQKSLENRGHTSRLEQVASALRRVPLLRDADWQTFPPQKVYAQKKVKKQSIMNLFSNLIDREQDRRLLTLDLTMLVIGTLTILLMLVADYLTWVVPTIPIASITRTMSLPLPPNNLTAPPASTSDGGTPVPAFTPAPAGSTTIQNVIGSVRVGTVDILYYIIFVLSLFFLLVLVRYYRLRLQYLRLAWSKMGGKQILTKSQTYSFFQSLLFPQFVCEVIIFMVMPYPWYNQLHSEDAKYLQIFMFCRVYLVFRFLYHYSQLYRSRNLVIRSSEFLRRSSFHVEFVDAMKVYFFENTVLTASLMYVGVVFIGGFCVFVAERNANSSSESDPEGVNGYSSFFNGVYFMVTAIRTIGYGDVKPITVVGRAITIVFQFTGVTLEGLIASVVVNKIAKTKEEKIVDEYLESFGAWCELRVASAMVIQAHWKTSLRYRYLHRKESEEKMRALLNALRRRREYLRVLQTNRARNAVRETDGSTAGYQLRQEANSVQHDANFKQMVRHFATAEKVHRTKKGDGSIFGVHNMQPNLEEEREDTFRRMPYLRERETQTSTQDLIERDRHFFSQNIDVQRWNRVIGRKQPRGFQPLRKFTSSKKVIGKYGERRIPIGKGHKSDIRNESLQHFREARLNFKRSIAPSSDHVIDTKLQIAYELLVSASKKLRRNVVLLQGLKRTARLELVSLKQLLTLSLSGGVEPPAATLPSVQGRGSRE